MVVYCSQPFCCRKELDRQVVLVVTVAVAADLY